LQPRAPAVDTAKRSKRPIETRWPANGMMISEGKGTQADSKVISASTPAYPSDEIETMSGGERGNNAVEHDRPVPLRHQ
jgi:hypothetical protein